MSAEATGVATEEWAPDPARPGFLRRVRIRTVGEVFADLAAAVASPEGGAVAGCDESFGVFPGIGHDAPWPEGHTVVFAVTGANEGHYVHVEVLAGARHHLVILGKTFDGPDAAWSFARRLADLLGV